MKSNHKGLLSFMRLSLPISSKKIQYTHTIWKVSHFYRFTITPIELQIQELVQDSLYSRSNFPDSHIVSQQNKY
jgi:hypothetical protein